MTRLSVSNLAWSGAVDATRCKWLAESGVAGVEIAPTALFQGTWPTGSQLADLVSTITDHGIEVSGLQSLLFGRPDLQLFDRETWPELTRRIRLCAEMAESVRASVLVFGSPRNRLRGELPASDAVAMAAEFFAAAATVAAEHGVVITLEPNPEAYGADFMTTYNEVLEVADSVGSEWVRPQVDTGCLWLSGVDAADAIVDRLPAHVHVSAPGLGALPGTGVDHAGAAAALDRVEYPGWVTLEMLSARLDSPHQLHESIVWARGSYGSAR